MEKKFVFQGFSFHYRQWGSGYSIFLLTARENVQKVCGKVFVGYQRERLESLWSTFCLLLERTFRKFVVKFLLATRENVQKVCGQAFVGYQRERLESFWSSFYWLLERTFRKFLVKFLLTTRENVQKVPGQVFVGILFEQHLLIWYILLEDF